MYGEIFKFALVYFKLRQNTYDLESFRTFESQNPRTRNLALTVLHTDLVSFGKMFPKK